MYLSARTSEQVILAEFGTRSSRVVLQEERTPCPLFLSYEALGALAVGAHA